MRGPVSIGEDMAEYRFQEAWAQRLEAPSAASRGASASGGGWRRCAWGRSKEKTYGAVDRCAQTSGNLYSAMSSSTDTGARTRLAQSRTDLRGSIPGLEVPGARMLRIRLWPRPRLQPALGPRGK